jgi:hypothetical protein
MTPTITIAGYCLIGTAVAVYEVASRAWRRTPTLAEAVGLATRSRVGRWVVLGGWLWLGWHLFARGDWH